MGGHRTDPGHSTSKESNVQFRGLKSRMNSVFFGRKSNAECEKCQLFTTNELGHRFCEQLACPIAIREFKRRQRRDVGGGPNPKHLHAAPAPRTEAEPGKA